MVPVDNAEVRWAILKYLASLIDAGHIEPLLGGGLTPEALEALRNRRLRDITTIAANPSIGFHVVLDGQALVTAFQRQDAARRDKELIEYFVRNGAPAQILTRLFRLSSQELRQMREVLCPGETERGGRPLLPEPSVREAIHASWVASADKAPNSGRIKGERERLYALHQQYPAYTLGTLWSVVNEFAVPGQSHV